jgi:programmed cell death 6-interacting protein
MLAVPLKETAEVEFVTTLGLYLKEHFKDVDHDSIDLSITSLSEMRARCTTISELATSSDEVRNRLLKYIIQLKKMSEKFPFTESRTGVQLAFEWGDAFKPTKKIGQYNLHYEMGSVMFNLASLYSLAGLNTDRNSDDFAKVACKYYQQAAGIFTELQQKVCPRMRGATTADLSPEGLQMIIDLMLAQAQALYYNKCHETPAAKLTRGNEGMKSALCAKLASHTANLYEKSLKVATSSSLSTVLHSAWVNRMKYQMHRYKSAACYKQSEVVHLKATKVGEGYGLELAYLQTAKAECLLAQSVVKAKGAKFSQSEISNVEGLLSKITTMLKLRLSDNEVIYLESIPDESDVPKIVPKAMAKLALPENFNTLFNKNNGTHDSDLFRLMIPTVVRKSAKKYEERLSNLLSTMDKKCREKNRLARESLASMGLPASIEATVQSVGLPDSVWAKVEDIQKKGGVAAMETITGNNQNAANIVRARLNDIENILNQEEDEDKLRRTGGGTSNNNGSSNDVPIVDPMWMDLPDSKIVNKDLRADIQRYAQLLKDVGPSDQYLIKLLNDNHGILQLLSKSREEISSRLPKMTQTTVAAAAPLRKALIDQLGKLNKLIGSRTDLLEVLKIDISNDHIGSKLMEAGCGTKSELHDEWTSAHEVSLFDHEEKKYDINKGDIENSFKVQASLLKTIEGLNTKFQKVKSGDENTKHREVVIQGINRAVDCYIDINEKLIQGQNFYNDIDKHTIELLQTTQDYCHGRRIQVEDVIAQQSSRDMAKKQMLADQEFAMNLEKARIAADEEAKRQQQQTISDEEFARRLQRMGSNELNYTNNGTSTNNSSPPPPPAYDAPPPSYNTSSGMNNNNNAKPSATFLKPPSSFNSSSNHTSNVNSYVNAPPVYDSAPALTSYDSGIQRINSTTAPVNSNGLSSYQQQPPGYSSGYPTYGGNSIANVNISSTVEDERLKQLSKFDKNGF